MKLFAILCFIGLAASASVNQLKWQPGQRYSFNYDGRLITGLPEMANHFSGLGIRCQVDLTVGGGSSSQQQEFGIKITNAHFTRVNQVLKALGGEQEKANWRQLELPEFTPIPEESKRYLENPVIFKLRPTGTFVSIVVSQDEPEWSVNFKKALVNIFQTQFQQEYSSQDVSDAINRIDQQSDDQNESVTYWRTQEESLDGVCDVTYQLNELPTYMVREQPQTVPYGRTCPEGSRFYELVKTRDVSSCTQRTAFSYYKPGFFQCSTGNCEGRWSRSSITRYVACGTSNGRLNIQSIVNEGELQQNLFGFNTEKFLTGALQNLTLVNQEESSASHQLPQPQNGIELNSLFYEYKMDGGRPEQNGALVAQSELEESTSAFKSLPRHILTTGTYTKEERQQINPDRLVPQIKKLFRQIVNEDLFNIVDIPEKQITFKGLSIARAFSLLSRSDISKLYQELKSEFSSEEKKEMFGNVFFDTLIMGGSVANVQFVKEMILKNELTNIQVASVFTFLPHYIIAPTEPLLESLYQLVTSDFIKQKAFLYNHAILSFSQLIQKACLAENRSTSYPTFVFGNFCSPDSQIVLNRWLPYLQQQISQSGSAEHRNTILVSLGLMSHKNVISIIVPYIERENPSSTEYSKLTRFLAIYSLGNVGRVYPEVVVPLVYSVFSNPAEATEVRIAAFNLILRMNPSMSVFHRVAAGTWWEKDNEVLQVVNTAFYSLYQEQEMNRGAQQLYTSVQRKAWLVYPLIKKTSGTFPTSGLYFTSDYMQRLGVGYRGIHSWIDSKDSLIPTNIYGRVVYFLDRYQFTPIEGALRFSGGWNLAEQILEIINPELKQEYASGQVYEQVKNQLHQEWRHVIEKLQLKARKSSGMVESALYLNLFEDSPIFHSFQSSSAEMLKQKVLPWLSNPSKMARILGGEETRVNFQRMINLAPAEFSIPSELGFPIVVEVHMPVTISVRGKMTLNAESTTTPSVRMEVKTLFATQMTGYVGTICPFTNEFVTTGIDEHCLVNLPAEISINLDVPQNKLKVKVHALNVNKAIDVFHFHVRPYTVHQKMYDLTPMTLSQNVRFIESRESTKRREITFGESWGLNLKAVLTTESPFVDLRAAIQKLAMFNYNPLNFMRFFWISTAQTEYGLPSFRKHEIQLKYNPGQSSTKEFEVQLQVGVATKQQEKEFRFHVVKSGQQQGQQGQQGQQQPKSLMSFLPYRIESRPVGEQQEQQGLQQQIKNMIEKTQVSEGQAVTVRVTTALRGNGRASGSSTYNLNFLSGRQGLQEKWNLHLENVNQNQKICVNGNLNVPQIPIWNIENLRNEKLEFSYVNEIGFGSNCQESKVVVRGNTKSNQEQKEHSRQSPEAQLLKKLQQQGAPLVEIEKVAEKVRRQASILNEVDFQVNWQNIPERYIEYATYASEAAKSILWPYWSDQSQMQQGQQQQQQQGGSRTSGNSNTRIVFNPRTQTFDLYVTTPTKTVKFMHVRIPTPINYLFPIPVARNNLLELSQQVVGKSFYPTCKVSGKWIQTYDNTTAALPLDECYHLLSGDCSTQKRFGVLVRKASGSSSQQGQQVKQVKIYIGRTSVELIPESAYSSSSYPNVKVVVNGTKQIEISSKRGRFIPIFDEHRNEICRVMASIDGVLVFKSKPVNILFNGVKVNVEASYTYKNQLCGLCGDLNNQKLADLRGPRQCVYSKPELLVASYRVPLPNHSCQPLPRQVQQELENETQKCAKYQEIPTKVVESFKLGAGKCSNHKHQVVVRGSEICISKIPTMECGVQCRPQAVVEKSIPFTCLKKGKLGEHYSQKARSGQVLPELENLPQTYSTKLHLPKSCEPINRGL